MRKKLLLVLATMSLLAGAHLLAAPTAAAETIDACTGYETVAIWNTAAGNLYRSERRVCAEESGTDPVGGVGDYRAVARFRCLRNGVSYAGCRFETYVNMQAYVTGGNWTDWSAEDYECYTCGGAFVADSGRLYEDEFHHADGAWIRAIASGGHTRFKLADGTITPLIYNSPEQIGPTIVAT